MSLNKIDDLEQSIAEILIASVKTDDKKEFDAHASKNIDAKNIYGDTILHFISRNPEYNNRIEYILSDSRVNCNIVNNHGETPLLAALNAANYYSLHMLLEHGAIIEVGEFITNPIIQAVKNGDYLALDMLLQYGGDVNSRDMDSTTAVEIAVNNNHAKVAAILLKHNVNASMLTEEKQARLLELEQFAISEFRESVEKASIAHPEALWRVDSESTASAASASSTSYEDIFASAKSGDDITLFKVLNSGLNPNVSDISGKSLLVYAIESENPLTAFIVQNFGADVSLLTTEQQTNFCKKMAEATSYIFAIARSGNLEKITELFNLGISPNYTAETGESVFNAIMESGSIESIKLALHHEADPSDFCASQACSLVSIEKDLANAFRAIITEDAEALNKILDGGLNPNSTDQTGKSLLAEAVQKNDVCAVLALTNHGANPDLLSPDDRSHYTDLMSLIGE
jgi:ankyrin repeat protein